MRRSLADSGVCSPRLLPTVTRVGSARPRYRLLRNSGLDARHRCVQHFFECTDQSQMLAILCIRCWFVQLCSVKRAESYHVELLLLMLLFSLLQLYGCDNIQTMATSALLLEQCVSYRMPFASPVTRHRPSFAVHALAARRSHHGCGRHCSQCSVCVSQQMQFANAPDTTSEQGKLLGRPAVNRRSLGVAAVILSFMTPLQTLAGE